MKRIILSILAISAVVAGCKKTAKEEGLGYMVLKSVTADDNTNDKEINASGTKANPSDLVDLNEFLIKIESGLEGGGTQTYKYADILDQAVTLATGNYILTASSPEGKVAAWDQPLFEGTKNFTVVAGAVSPVEVKCTLKNAIVSVKCTDTFKTELSSYNIKVSASNDDFLTWTKDNIGNDGYFDASELNIQIDGVREIDGSTAALTAKISNIHPKDHIILNLDAKVTGEVQTITLTLDGSVLERNQDILVDGFEEIPIPDPDPTPDPTPTPDPEPSDPTLPTLVWEANPTYAVTELKSDGMSAEMTVNAPNKIKEFLIDVKSDYENFETTITQLAGSLTMDLINNTDATFVSMMKQVNIPTGDEIKGQTSVPFSLSSILPMILVYKPDGDTDSYHSFTLRVTDESGNTLTQELKFHYMGN